MENQDVIKVILQSTYQKAFSEINDILSNLISFKNSYNVADIDWKQQEQLTCDDTYFAINVIKDLTKHSSINKFIETSNIPFEPSCMTPEDNKIYRKLVDNCIKNSEQLHDYLIM